MKNASQVKIDKETSISDLIVLGIFLLSEKKIKVSFENLLEKCFQLSPALISFKKHEWPDARKLDRPLRSLRNNGLIEKKAQCCFYLTKRGRKKSLEISKKLYQGKLL